jgi:predicted NBD/HSP70 family sugar kinase
MRRHNLGTLLGHLHHDGELSRAELTGRMGLNRSTIGGLVGELVSADAVVETVPSGGRHGAGRPSLGVRPCSERAVTLAADIGVDRLRVAVVGIGGEVLVRAEAATPASGRVTDVAAKVVSLLCEVAAQAPPQAALIGLGVSVPGVVSDDGMVRFAPNLGWIDVQLAELLHAQLDPSLPLRVANDADLGALAEHTRGAGVGHDDIVFLDGDVGVGGGVVVAGQALHGAGGYAGELGHMMINPAGGVCRCGSRGCWETEIGLAAVLRQLGEADVDAGSLPARLQALSRPPAGLRRVGRYLGLGLASIVNLFNPEVIIMGGILRDLYPLTKEITDEAMRGAMLVAPGGQVSVVVPRLGGDAVLVGAAEMAFARLLSDPLQVLADATDVGAWVGFAGARAGAQSHAKASLPA